MKTCKTTSRIVTTRTTFEPPATAILIGAGRGATSTMAHETSLSAMNQLLEYGNYI